MFLDMQVSCVYFILGQDASDMFISVGHSKDARLLMKRFVLGQVVPSNGNIASEKIEPKRAYSSRLVILLSLVVLLSSLFFLLIKREC